MGACLKMASRLRRTAIRLDFPTSRAVDKFHCTLKKRMRIGNDQGGRKKGRKHWNNELHDVIWPRNFHRPNARPNAQLREGRNNYHFGLGLLLPIQ